MSNPQSKTILKDTRIEKGLSLEIVHEATKIPMDALRAIEEGYSVKMLTPFYYKGFVKIYAQFLGLDIKDVAINYGLKVDEADLKATPIAKTHNKQHAAKPSYTTSKPKVKQPISTGPNPWEGFGNALKSVVTPKNLNVLLRLIAVVGIVFVVVKIGGCVKKSLGQKKDKPVSSSSVHAKDKEAVVKKAVTPPAPEPVAKTEAKAPAPVETPKTLKAQSENQKVSLAIRVSKDNWIQVKADGRTVFQAVLKKGGMESWVADDVIELSGKNVNDLDMEVNGKHIGTLGMAERGAKRVIITKDGLVVKK